MAKIIEFDTGYCTHPECVVTGKLSLKKKKFPAKVWLIETHGKRYLWDTGYSEHFISKKWNHQLYKFVTPVNFHKQEHLSEQLKAAGLSHGDIDSIFISHLHADHCAGLLDFPTTQVYLHQDCQKIMKEDNTIKLLLNGCLPDLYMHLYNKAIKKENLLHFFNELPYSILPKELLPFSFGYKVNEEFYIIDLPGHAVGHVGAFIHNGNEWILLGSDSAWLKEAYLEKNYPSFLANTIMHNRKEYINTLLKLNELYNNSGCPIILSHE